MNYQIILTKLISIIHTDMNNKNSSQITNGVYIFLDNYLGELDFQKKKLIIMK